MIFLRLTLSRRRPAASERRYAVHDAARRTTVTVRRDPRPRRPGSPSAAAATAARP